MNHSESTMIVFDDLLVDLQARHVSRNGEVLRVTARSFELLRYLLERHPQISAPREIIAGVWPGSIVSNDALTQRVRLLRRQLGGQLGRYVTSVHGLGYRLAVAPTPCTASQAAPASSAVRERAWPRAHPYLATALAAVLASAILGGALLFHDPHAAKHALKHRLGGADAR